MVYVDINNLIIDYFELIYMQILDRYSTKIFLINYNNKKSSYKNYEIFFFWHQ